MDDKPTAAALKTDKTVDDKETKDDEKKPETTPIMSSAESREDTSKETTLECEDSDPRAAENDTLDEEGSDSSLSTASDLDSARDPDNDTAPAAEVASATSSWAVLAPLLLSGSATMAQKLQGLACIRTSGVNLRVGGRRRITAVLMKSLQDEDEEVRDAAVDASIRMAGCEHERMYEFVVTIHDAVAESFWLPYKRVPSALHKVVLKVFESGDGVYTNLLGVLVVRGSLRSLKDESMESVDSIVSFLKRSLATTPPIYRVVSLLAIQGAFNHTVLAPAAFNAFATLIPDLINLAHESIKDENCPALEFLKCIASVHLHVVLPFRSAIEALCEKIDTEAAEHRAISAELRARLAVNEETCECCERTRTWVPPPCRCPRQERARVYDEED